LGAGFLKLLHGEQTVARILRSQIYQALLFFVAGRLTGTLHTRPNCRLT
jgi:hypothetical protein